MLLIHCISAPSAASSVAMMAGDSNNLLLFVVWVAEIGPVVSCTTYKMNNMRFLQPLSIAFLLACRLFQVAPFRFSQASLRHTSSITCESTSSQFPLDSFLTNGGTAHNFGPASPLDSVLFTAERPGNPTTKDGKVTTK